MKRLHATILLLALCLTAMAQVGSPRRDLAVGLNGGLSLNRMSFRPSVKQSYHLGPEIGVTARYTCEKYFKLICAIQAELNYSMLGWKEDIVTCDETYRRDMHFLQIPVLAHLGFGREHNGVKGFFVAGPQVGIFLNDTELPSWTGTPGPRPNNVTMQYGKAVDNKFDYGIVVGGGLEVSTRGRLHFLAEARYYFALGDMFANSKKDPFGRSANSTIEVKISVLYDVIRTK